MGYKLEMDVFFPVPPATVNHTLLLLNNMWIDSTTSQSRSVIRRVPFQYLRLKPIYLLNSSSASKLFSFHILRAGPASGRGWEGAGALVGSCSSPHPLVREEMCSGSSVPPPSSIFQAKVRQCVGRLRAERWQELTYNTGCPLASFLARSGFPLLR